MAPRKPSPISDQATAFRMLGEKLKSTAIRPNIWGYRPHTKQVEFHTSTARKKLYIGGNRSGKTTGGIVEDIWWLTGRHPYREVPPAPVRGRIVTVDFVTGAEQIIIPEILRWLPVSDLINGSWQDSYSKELRTLTLANGSFVEFKSYDQDLEKFAGTSRHFIHYDEEPPEVIYTENQARLVDTGGSFWITMTPVEGMTWVFDQIYEPGLAGESEIKIIEVDMTENPYLNQAEVQAFLGSLSEDERNARVHGKFVQVGGKIYKKFDPKPGGMHIVKDGLTQDIPKDWIWVVSLDHGLNNPTAAYWHAISPDGKVLTFYEHYVAGWTVDKHAKRILEINSQLGRPPDYYVADPSIRNKNPITGTSIHEEYVKYGIPFTLGNNDVAAGIIRVARYMEPQADGVPLWRVTDNCEKLIWELGRYRWKTYNSKKIASQNNPFDVPHKKDDHGCDSLRYFIMSRPELTSEYSAQKDYVDREFENVLGLPMAVGGEGQFADPWKTMGNSPTPSEYTKIGSDFSVDEYLGGEW